ncbi:MAG: hypothetical protein RL341_1084, partial [Pseudomonadota bacterium]
MRTWGSTSLMTRFFLAQVLAVIVAVTLFGAMISYGLAQRFGEHYAQRWAPSLHAVLKAENVSAMPASRHADSEIKIAAAPPDAPLARIPRGSMRFDALQSKLREQGLPVAEMRISGLTGNAVVWLRLQAATGPARWAAIPAPVEGIEVPRQVHLTILATLLVVAVLAWLLSRWLTGPTRNLAPAMRRAQSGELTAHADLVGTTEHRELAQGFNRMMTAFANAERERDLMLAGISHDLRSPLTRIRMAAEGVNDAKARERIVRNVEVADQVLGSFLDFVRLDHTELTDDVDVVELTHQVAAVNQIDSARLGITLPDAFSIRGSALLLTRALQNLIDNANRHGKPPVWLAAKIEHQVLLLSVTDHGQGIAEAQAQEAMQPFVRLPNHREGEGSGLGLAVVDRIARRHGGC